jgi:hypothetical protein
MCAVYAYRWELAPEYSDQESRCFMRHLKDVFSEVANVRWREGGVMEQIANIEDYITVLDCATAGTVKSIKESDQDMSTEDPMLIYEIETVHGLMRLPADWLARLIEPSKR